MQPASQVEIKIETNHEKLDLVISDNGVGFDTNKKSKGIGLRNIDNRVRFYNGITHVISQPGKGCRLEIFIPMRKIMNLLS
jgi:two-component system sensor histidine kinase UhpB